MAKRARPSDGKCVHCLAQNVPRNWDHVIPRAWYPSDAIDLVKWKVPSCLPCNSSLAQIEAEFLMRIAACLDPSGMGSTEMWRKVQHSMDPSRARDPSDGRRREHLRDIFMSQLLVGDHLPKDGIYPGLGPADPSPNSEQMGFLIPVSLIEAIARKIIRGIWFNDQSLFVEPPYSIAVYPMEEVHSGPIRALINTAPVEHCRPGVHIRYVVDPADLQSGIFEIVLWSKFKVFATIINN